MLIAAAIIYGIVLAGEPVQVDANAKITFTAAQMRSISFPTRQGLVLLASTPDGRRLLRKFAAREYAIVVTEGAENGEAGSAPEPGIATLVAWNDHSVCKQYEIVLHPITFSLPEGATAFPHQADTPADQMAAAWAAELLHIEFYARGISLPHHQRADFQREWQTIVQQLGFPTMTHGEEEESGTDRLILMGGERTWRRR